MQDDASLAPPSQIQLIGILHLVGGIFNLISAGIWGLYGGVATVSTFGIGFFLCCPVFIALPVAVMEFISAAKHLSSDHTGLKEPRITAVAEICSILVCSTFSMIFGIITLVLLNDPKVQAYYRSKQGY